MEPLKGPREAVGRFVAVFGSDIDHLRVRCQQGFTGQRQAAVSDVFAYADAAQGRKDSLEIKGRYICALCNLPDIQCTCQIGLNIT